jgi:spore coat polysaccharide biosynthesis protein SpsF (cytidylyltransferase family)
MKTNAVIGIQARTSSKRYPNKVMAEISGHPIIEWVVRNSRLSGCEVFVLTSTDPSDDELVSFLENKSISFYRGPLDNVLLRFLNFMNKQGVQKVLRVSADSPLIHPNVIDKILIAAKIYPEYDVITNVFPRTFPKGQSVELLSKFAIESISGLSLSTENKEHVSSYFYANPSEFKIKNIENHKDISSINLCVDTPEDLIRIQEIVDLCEFNLEFEGLSWQDFSNAISTVKKIS